jgi:CheY-like chemotaxis protein
MVRSVPTGLPERLGLAALRAGRLSRPTAKLASATPKRSRSLGYPVAMRDIRLEELQGIHVLVIDDDLHARHYLRSVLELWGAIVTATSTADAIRVALIADVIVCDLTSAEHANGEFLERLRHMHIRQGRRVPAIALVARGLKDARVRAPGFQRYLGKPVDGDELRTAVVDLARE